MANLFNDTATAGRHALTWTGLDTAGKQLASGTYVCRLIADNGAAVQKLVLLK